MFRAALTAKFIAAAMFARSVPSIIVYAIAGPDVKEEPCHEVSYSSRPSETTVSGVRRMIALPKVLMHVRRFHIFPHELRAPCEALREEEGSGHLAGVADCFGDALLPSRSRENGGRPA